jgi:PadR family transcriptional regulator, regulatory protein PadR
MAKQPLGLLQGTLDMLVLKALVFGPRHGYGVTRWVRETTGGRLDIEEGALYTALHRMERRGWISAEWGVSENNRRARYYRLTRQGRRHLQAELRAWQRYTAAVRQVLEPRAGES